jgi:hypothetical protein
MTKWNAGGNGIKPMGRRADRLRMPRRIKNDCTLATIPVKARRPGDNPGPAVAPACTDPRRAVDCPPTIFEVQDPPTRQTSRGLAWIVRSADGSHDTRPDGEQKPYVRGGLRSCLP